ncbi:hypothetical protein VW23_026380 [Devosia insulae DS-56]|uniref:Uncharacterized protein n=1 Tax=Devosia insulae DS-56 TaxID=1116389 RepID=A0A1E5XL10_9HYPH|nr:hypothetical protein [Devosia insulae]OEO29296.1 hypothetical protein VW23_026380 [Devosia insulae DS-56]
MQIKLIVAAAALAALALPLAVFASQPQDGTVRPAPSLAKAQILSMLMLDPRETGAEFTVKLPEGYATLDVDADPFEVVAN